MLPSDINNDDDNSLLIDAYMHLLHNWYSIYLAAWLDSQRCKFRR